MSSICSVNQSSFQENMKVYNTCLVNIKSGLIRGISFPSFGYKMSFSQGYWQPLGMSQDHLRSKDHSNSTVSVQIMLFQGNIGQYYSKCIFSSK